VGPFFHDALLDEDRSERVSADHPEAIRIEATVYDREGDPLSDAIVEIWQANGAGRYNDPVDDREDLLLDEGFSGFGRPGTDAGGRFSFVTVKPGPVPGPDGGMQAPQSCITLTALVTLGKLDELEMHVRTALRNGLAEDEVKEVLL